MNAAGRQPEVVIEATYGWYWIVDVVQELGANVHLANPNALNWGAKGQERRRRRHRSGGHGADGTVA